ncbi:MAG: DUF190 domain-containing protein [Candidatus Marinimicrobia bacterium]|nr:DUF190 domain-containing protein [Candidatus Neomarinimicrobiota bacterium]
MLMKKNATLLRIMMGDSDRIGSTAAYEKIVLEAKKYGLAGATVIKGIMGFGATSRIIHSSKILRLSEDLPHIIEIVDEQEKIEGFLPVLNDLLARTSFGGLITVSPLEVIKYSAGEQSETD